MSRLASLRDEFTNIQGGIATIERAATEAGRDLTDAEQADTDTFFARAAELKPLIEAEVAKTESVAATAAALARVNGSFNINRAAPAADNGPKTTADWLAAKYTGRIDRAAGDQVTSEVEVPAAYVSDTVNLIDPRRPVFSAMRHPAFVPAMSFQTSRVTQHVDIDKQSAQLAALATREYSAVLDSWSTETWGGKLTVARQVLDLSPASVFADIVADFQDVYAVETEARACQFLASVDGPSVAWSTSSIASIVTSITNGIQALYDASKMAPDTLFLSLDETLAMTNKFNTNDDVSALERLNKSLAAAGFNLNIVTGFALPSDTRILTAVNRAGGVAVRERLLGLLSAPEVSHLEVAVAYAGYLQFSGYDSHSVHLV